MPAPSIRFDPPYDIHLLRGQALQIVNEDDQAFQCLLRIGDRNAHDYIDDHALVDYRFRFSFDQAHAADFGIVVTVPNAADPAAARKPDCLITLNAAEPVNPVNRLRNFYLIAEVTNHDDDSRNETRIRVHIHQRIEEIWLTPNPLTIYRGLTARYSLRARFNDDVVAEIGRIVKGDNGSRINYRITNPVVIEWSSSSASITIVADTGRIRVQGNAAGLADVAVKTTFNGQEHTHEALLRISDLLTAQSTLRAELVANGNCPGFPKLNDVPNILFMAEGFKIDQKEAFKELIIDYVSDLVNKKITSPFNLLKGSINYWMLFVPSFQSGTTYRGELIVKETVLDNGAKRVKGHSIPFVENPKLKAVKDWEFKHLLFFVGLPIRADKDISDADLKSKWTATTRLVPADLNKLFEDRKDLIKKWKEHAERRLPDAKDTAFGTTVNDYTAALEDDDEHNLINLDSRRIQRSDLDAFFSELKDTANNIIGTTFVMDNEQLRGKDWDNIIMIMATNRGRAQNAQGYMFATAGNKDSVDLEGIITDKRFAAAPMTLPTKLPLLSKKTTTHEICHSFGLGDEYGEGLPREDFQGKPVTDPLVAGWTFANYDDNPQDQDWTTNLQAKADLLVPVSTGGMQIQPYRLKWRYHRIQKCGIVTALTLNNNELTLTLQPGQTARFEVNKGVFFRKRKKNETEYLIREDAAARTLLGTVLLPNPLAGMFHGRATITGVNAANHTIVIEMAAGAETVELTLREQAGVVFTVGQSIRIVPENRRGPVYTLFRTPTAEGVATNVTKALSPLLTVKSINATQNQLVLTIPAGVTLMEYLTTFAPNDAILVYRPMDVPEGRRAADYPHYELIAQDVLNHLLVKPFAFNTNNDQKEIIENTSNSNISPLLVPCCSKRKKEIIGLYAGGARHHGGIYHPAAQCMMRRGLIDGEFIELCAVCRYTLVNLIDPMQFEAFDEDYMKRKIYP